MSVHQTKSVTTFVLLRYPLRLLDFNGYIIQTTKGTDDGVAKIVEERLVLTEI
jgi:hypothetical protein